MLLFVAAALAMPPDAPTPPGAVTLRQAADAAQIAWPPPGLRLHIDKSDRRLSVFSGDTKLKTYRVGLGGAPSGDKVRQGDLKTPTGDFTIVTRNPRSSYHLFLGVSYPAAEDAERGFEAGLISAAQRDAIIAADRQDVAPPWNTRLGGLIGIHGNGGSADWTLGCIAVEDWEIEELWEIVRKRTPVRIEE